MAQVCTVWHALSVPCCIVSCSLILLSGLSSRPAIGVRGCLQPEDAVVVFVRSCGSVCNKQPLQFAHTHARHCSSPCVHALVPVFRAYLCACVRTCVCTCPPLCMLLHMFVRLLAVSHAVVAHGFVGVTRRRPEQSCPCRQEACTDALPAASERPPRASARGAPGIQWPGAPRRSVLSAKNTKICARALPEPCSRGLQRWCDSRTKSSTPAYMAPEQMLQSRALITPQTDIYNLAAVLFYLARRSRTPPCTLPSTRRWTLSHRRRTLHWNWTIQAHCHMAHCMKTARIQGRCTPIRAQPSRSCRVSGCRCPPPQPRFAARNIYAISLVTVEGLPRLGFPFYTF